jgi:ppGpp synthetase/RelA/SpoT-type nucleotidyltranferase
MLPIHQRLGDEVKYILERKIKFLSVEVGHLSSRAKTLASFCEKIERKIYKNPLKEITDLSGVRIVFLYPSDRARLERLVEEEFEIHEKVDKVVDQGVEKFGYGALHYIVSLKEQHAGARYDDLRGVRCEIQIRTILQDAWAIVAHHLSYKHEDDIPNELKRKLHALSGLFETADDQFERLNYARIEYQNKVKESISSNSGLSLEADLNLDSLLGYMAWKFPNRDTSSQEAAADLLEELNQFGYKKLKAIDDAVNRSWDAVLASEREYPPQNEDEYEPSEYLGVGLIRGALEFTDKNYLDSRNSDFSNARVAEFLHLLK